MSKQADSGSSIHWFFRRIWHSLNVRVDGYELRVLQRVCCLQHWQTFINVGLSVKSVGTTK